MKQMCFLFIVGFMTVLLRLTTCRNWIAFFKRRMFSVLSIKGASSAYLREGKAKKMLPWFQSFPWYDKSNMQVKYVDFGNCATQP